MFLIQLLADKHILKMIPIDNTGLVWGGLAVIITPTDTWLTQCPYQILSFVNG